MDETKILAKLSKIAGLYAGATTPGERTAAKHAMAALSKKLASEREQVLTEWTFSLGDPWNRKLFVSLARRHGLNPYRYSRQRYTTVMLRATSSLVKQTLWPQYLQLSGVLTAYLNEVSDRLIAKSVYEDSSEAAVVAQPKGLAAAGQPQAVHDSTI